LADFSLGVFVGRLPPFLEGNLAKEERIQSGAGGPSPRQRGEELDARFLGEDGIGARGQRRERRMDAKTVEVDQSPGEGQVFGRRRV
jgi:hypothetical protein